MTHENSNRSLLEDDIRPAALMVDKEACVEWDRNFLLQRKDQWTEVCCPACGENEYSKFGAKNGFGYVECNTCNTVYTNPRPNQQLSHAFYAASKNYEYWNKHIFPATEDVRRQRIFRPRAERLASLCDGHAISNRAFLDVGAAFGSFCAEVKQLDIFDQIIALEPTPDLAATCREKGFQVIESPLEQVTSTGIVDVLSAFEVIEHVFDPSMFLAKCRDLLRDEGMIILSCPSSKGFDTLVLGVDAGAYDHEHVNYFTPTSLPLLLKRCGFTVVDTQTPGELDVDLVCKAVKSGRCSLPRFFNELLVMRGPETHSAFQSFLANNLLSSHLWVVAKKS